ncbi:recombinase family protein [Rubripirellula lacrimiformis]|nr:recombinase family protein [Rubripirellula lacrimiformis]
MYDDQGKLVKRIGFKERFRKPPTWSSQLVPSEDATVVDSIRWMFDAVRQGHSVGHVCRGLNERGLTTIAEKPFTYNTVLGMIQNPTYAGKLVAGRSSKAKFCRFDQEGLIIVEDAHEAIVSPDVFDAVQATLANRKRSHQRGDAGKYMLSGLVRCIHCGNRMHGVHRQDRGRETPQIFYQCGNAPLTPGFDPKCPHPVVRQDRLEAFIIDTLRTHLMKTKAAEHIKDAIRRAKTKRSKQVTGDERKLASVRQKIERGTENLALADRENFAAISKLLSTWRDEESALLARIENRAVELAPLPEAIDVIERLGEAFTKIKSADRVKLAHAIRLTVESITIGTRNAKTGGIKYPEIFGELTVIPTLAKRPMPIPDEAIGRRKIWREIADLVRQSKTPLHLKDFCRHIGTEDASHAAYHVRRAELAGLIMKVGHRGGWVVS